MEMVETKGKKKKDCVTRNQSEFGLTYKLFNLDKYFIPNLKMVLKKIR